MARRRPRPPCPNPEKKAFRDRIAAALHAADGERINHWNSEPYRCPAGHWHLRTKRRRP